MMQGHRQAALPMSALLVCFLRCKGSSFACSVILVDLEHALTGAVLLHNPEHAVAHAGSNGYV